MSTRIAPSKQPFNRFKAIVLVPFVGILLLSTGPSAFGADGLPACTQKRAGQVVGDRACVRTNGKWAWRDLVPVSGTPTANPSASQPPQATQKPSPKKTPLNLAQVPPVKASGGRVGPFKVSGTLYTNSLSCDGIRDTEEFCSWEFDLSRKYSTLRSVLGHDDSSDTDRVLRARIYADQTLVWDQEIPFGTAIPIQLDVSNVLRLRLAVVDPGYDPFRRYAKFVWGDIRVE
jgi:hypothetical protein